MQILSDQFMTILQLTIDSESFLKMIWIAALRVYRHDLLLSDVFQVYQSDQIFTSFKGLSIKDVRNQGGGGLPVRILCVQGSREILHTRKSALLGAKSFGFFEI